MQLGPEETAASGLHSGNRMDEQRVDHEIL